MTGQCDPWDVPEWHALGREAALTRHLLASGVTAIGKANYADQFGEYYTAFFGLSVGIERLAKLIYVADYAMANGGRMPSEQRIRDFGHRLRDLVAAADRVAVARKARLRYSRPTNAITSEILVCLDAFADASRGRYANFRSLEDPARESHEPVRRWWDVVATAILTTHYNGTPTQARVDTNARIAHAALSPFSSVLYITESGAPMRDVFTASVRIGQARIVQKYGRYYTLLLVRWLAELYSVLAEQACHEHGIVAFFGSSELFWTFTVEDRFLRTRKQWPL